MKVNINKMYKNKRKIDDERTQKCCYEIEIEQYMKEEVWPYIPDAEAFFEEDLGKKKPVIKTGAEIPFSRCFYKYVAPVPSDELELKFMEIESSVNQRVSKLFSEV